VPRTHLGVRFVESLLGLILLSGCRSLGTVLHDPPSTPGPLKIIVVGSGVKPLGTVQRYHRNYAQGNAMRAGVDAAAGSEQFEEWRKDVTIEYVEDSGDPKEAEKWAQRLALDPNVIAIIGHATSGTTRPSIPYYARARIPLLMPIATGKNVMLGHHSGASPIRYSNCLRLPPCDVPYQAAAIMLAAQKLLGVSGKTALLRKRICLLVDHTEESKEYSIPLETELRRFLQPNITVPVTLYPTNTIDPIRTAAAEDPDLLIFCGYAETARSLLRQIPETFPADKCPVVLLTDGCFSSHLITTSGLVAYVTFPSPDIRTLEACPDHPALQGALAEPDRPSTLFSYEMFGYDALLLLEHAFSKCVKERQPISRDNVLRQLRSLTDYSGSCRLLYAFDAFGENRHPRYYLYKCIDSSDGLTVVLDAEYEAEELAAIANTEGTAP